MPSTPPRPPSPWLESSWPSAKLHAALVKLRTKELKNEQRKEKLLKRGLVAKLAFMLDRPNAKVVDVALSILGNLLMEEAPRIQLRQLRTGLSVLANVLTSRQQHRSRFDEALLARAARACANAAQDAQSSLLLQADGRLLPALVRLCQAPDTGDKTRQVVIRAFRILGGTPDQKRDAVQHGVVSCVARCLGSDDEELLKAATKCLAHFTHGCKEDIAAQIRGEDGGGFGLLVGLMRHSKRSVWEAAMASLVNLSHVDSLRPVLGNAGVIIAMVDKLNQIESLNSKEIAHCVTALCLYCRESVNRMKLREFGGLRLFVTLLGDGGHKSLHNRILNSLMQFAYDDQGLKVLLHYGVVPVLIGFLREHTERHRVEHDCAEEICRIGGPTSDDEEEEKGDSLASDETKPVPAAATTLKEAVDDFEEKDEPSMQEVEIAIQQEQRGDHDRGFNPDDPKIDVEQNQQQQPEGAVGGIVEAPSRFRVNSPSYRAVQHEFEAFMRIRGDGPSASSEPGPWRPHVYTNPWRGGGDGASSSPSLHSSFTVSPEDSLCQSPDRSPPISCLSSSPGYSPAYSIEGGSPGVSPGRGGAGPSYSYSPHYEPSGPIDDDEGEASYSPVERFSEEEEDEEVAPQPPREPPKRDPPRSSEPLQRQTSLSPSHPSTSCSQSSPPPMKRQRHARCSFSSPPPPDRKRSIFSPAHEPSFGSMSPPAGPSSPPPPPSQSALRKQFGVDAAAPTADVKGRVGWILQILSRMSQAERPHEDLLALETSLALVDYLCFTSKPLPRAGRILTRLTKNLYSVMPFVRQRHVSHFRLLFAARPTLKDSFCKSCKALDQLRASLEQNVSLLAETGFAEGQICHSLMRGPKEEKFSMAVSAPLLVKPRKLLRNILLKHGGLDMLLDCMEEAAADDDDNSKEEKKASEESKEENCDKEEKMEEGDDNKSVESEKEKNPQEPKSDASSKKDRATLLSHAVLSSHSLGSHLGVVSPNLKLQPRPGPGRCLYETNRRFGSSVEFRLDDASTVQASRQVMIKESSVFEAMLSGQFVESDQSEVRLPGTSRQALLPLVHRLHGCGWCKAFNNLTPADLLELAALSDRYLLPEFNRAVASEIVLRCLRTSEVVGVYAGSLQGAFVVQGLEGEEATLSACTVSYLLVGAMPHETRVEVFKELLRSNMKGDFLDDIGKLLREKLLEQR